VGADYLRAVPTDRTCLGNIQCLTLWNPLGNINQYHVVEILLGQPLRRRASDVPRTYHGDLRSRHHYHLNLQFLFSSFFVDGLRMSFTARMHRAPPMVSTSIGLACAVRSPTTS